MYALWGVSVVILDLDYGKKELFYIVCTGLTYKYNYSRYQFSQI